MNNKNNNTLTEREREIYEYIVNAIRNEGYSPSVRDICNALGMKSTSTVHTYLERLERKGVIQKESGKSRTLRVENETVRGAQTVRVPIVGKVAAGMPILAVENYEGFIDVPRPGATVSGSDLFALRIQGESMIEAGILDGDLIIVEKRTIDEDGEIIVALVDDEATVKTFYRDGDRFRLQPENSSMEPIYVRELVILGKVVACMRFYK